MNDEKYIYNLQLKVLDLISEIANLPSDCSVINMKFSNPIRLKVFWIIPANHITNSC